MLERGYKRVYPTAGSLPVLPSHNHHPDVIQRVLQVMYDEGWGVEIEGYLAPVSVQCKKLGVDQGFGPPRTYHGYNYKSSTPPFLRLVEKLEAVSNWFEIYSDHVDRRILEKAVHHACVAQSILYQPVLLSGRFTLVADKNSMWQQVEGVLRKLLRWWLENVRPWYVSTNGLCDWEESIERLHVRLFDRRIVRRINGVDVPWILRWRRVSEGDANAWSLRFRASHPKIQRMRMLLLRRWWSLAGDSAPTDVRLDSEWVRAELRSHRLDERFIHIFGIVFGEAV